MASTSSSRYAKHRRIGEDEELEETEEEEEAGGEEEVAPSAPRRWGQRRRVARLASRLMIAGVAALARCAFGASIGKGVG